VQVAGPVAAVELADDRGHRPARQR
jgi:hypothetical protein